MPFLVFNSMKYFQVEELFPKISHNAREIFLSSASKKCVWTAEWKGRRPLAVSTALLCSIVLLSQNTILLLLSLSPFLSSRCDTVVRNTVLELNRELSAHETYDRDERNGPTVSSALLCFAVLLSQLTLFYFRSLSLSFMLLGSIRLRWSTVLEFQRILGVWDEIRSLFILFTSPRRQYSGRLEPFLRPLRTE